MKSKKRYVIAFWIAASLVVILAISMVAILSAFTANASSGFEITYTAGANVQATITSSYQVGDNSPIAVSTSDGTHELVFNTGDTAETVSKSFDKMTGITMGKDDVILITYIITNDSTTAPVKLTASSSIVADNLTITYSKDNSTWKSTINDSAVIPTSGLSIAKGATQNVYIKIAVATKTTGASFDGTFNFALTTL